MTTTTTRYYIIETFRGKYHPNSTGLRGNGQITSSFAHHPISNIAFGNKRIEFKSMNRRKWIKLPNSSLNATFKCIRWLCSKMNNRKKKSIINIWTNQFQSIFFFLFRLKKNMWIIKYRTIISNTSNHFYLIGIHLISFFRANG